MAKTKAVSSTLSIFEETRKTITMFLDKFWTTGLLLMFTPLIVAFNANPSIDLGRWKGQGGLQSTTLLCLESKFDTKMIRVTSSHGGSDFALMSGNQRLPIKVALINQSGKRDIQPFESLPIPKHYAPDLCLQGMPLTLSIAIHPDHLYKSSAGNYQGQLVVTVFSE